MDNQMVWQHLRRSLPAHASDPCRSSADEAGRAAQAEAEGSVERIEGGASAPSSPSAGSMEGVDAAVAAAALQPSPTRGGGRAVAAALAAASNGSGAQALTLCPFAGEEAMLRR